MFKKLKEKITEEVKISPQRFQQLTQSVSEKLQGSNSTDDNFFSIGEDDANISSASTVDQGFSSVTLVSPSAEDKMRRSSVSSLASDISFLPRYESSNIYHLQSDLDVSASEIEDNVSQSSSNVGRVSKEQLYSAYKKSQMHYHKYRGRYTDLARHYKELEREISKMKSVLVDTQDKAIRRVTELKEQCVLEQKAKAHLESVLRDELDEKQMKIQSLQTKINLLQGKNSSETLMELEKANIDINQTDPEKLEQLTKYLNDARTEIEDLNSKIHEYKANTIVFQSKEQEYKNKISSLENDIISFSDREKENNIKLAENKMELHNELLSKDSEINHLKKEIDILKVNVNIQDKDGKSTKLENLQIQNNKLIEKVETLMQKCNGLENELLKVEKYRMDIKELTEQNISLSKRLEENKDIQNNLNKITVENNNLQDYISNLKQGLNNVQENLKKLNEDKINLLQTIEHNKIEYEAEVEMIRENAKKGLFQLENHISSKLQKEFKQQESLLKKEFAKKIAEISLNNDTIKEVHMKLIDKENNIEIITNELECLREKLLLKENNFADLEKNHLELIEESNNLRKIMDNLERQATDVTNKYEISQEYAKKFEEEIERIQKLCNEKEENNIKLAKEILKLESANCTLMEKVRLVEEKQELLEMEPTENNLLEIKVQTLEQEKSQLLESFEQERKMFNQMLQENKELKVKDIKIEELEIGNYKLQEKVLRLKGYLKSKEAEIVKLHKTKLDAEQEIFKLNECIKILREQEETIEIDKTECNLLQIKVQQLENEKENLIESFEKERDVFNQTFHQKNIEFDLHKEEIMNDNVSLAKENVELKHSYDEIIQKVRLMEEREQVVELDTSECNLLKVKLDQLEKEKQDILQGFEMEREMFNKILVEHKDLKLKEEHIKTLEESNKHLTEKLAEFKEYLKKKDVDIVVLQKVKLILEEDVSQLKESLRIHQEKIEALQIEETECNLLEMKLQALEEEKQRLLASFERERKTFEDTLAKKSNFENKIEKLTEENVLLTKQLHKLRSDYEKIQEQHSVKMKEQDEIITGLQKENDTLSSIIDRKEVTVSEKLQSVKLQLQKQQDENAEIKKELDMLQKTYNKEKYESSRTLEAKDDKFNEIINAKNSLEKELEKKIEEFDFKNRELSIIEQQFSMLTQERDNLLTDNKKVKQKLDEMYKDHEYLQSLLKQIEELNQTKMQNELLQVKHDKLNQEISELELRVNQLSSDNRNIIEDNEKLTVQCEEYKANSEFLENERKENQFKLEQDNVALQKYITELTDKLSKLQADYETLNQTTDINVNSDLSTIKKEFYELKEKCDNLFIENRNIKLEYEKLQEQCDNFSKVKKDLNDQLEELKSHYNELLNEKQLLQDEVQELKISPLNFNSSNSRLDNLNLIKQETVLNAIPHGSGADTEVLQREINNLNDKLVQYKSLDVTNQSSIEFYENELQKMKNKNEKLNRKLDETLVTLNHCAELSSSTEIEYLRNVLYNYMLGKESLVLARVIAAVCKFDSNQTEAVLQKEQQKQTLLGQLGLL
ncbi:hypothetical protein GWI33_017491 [Rhynchophorus ferrugineus]|uniref:GRIP domain-containing protein n=1 Tax=Rhynchophorus ferrugineus TaxID=354439 RepID=A0A834HZP9_RHYFE|nr:hypothetical protein GWI33_017491 [Rhynchophorus ferrugineus]